MKNHTKGILLASLTASLWGFLAIALNIAASFAPTMTIVWFRFSVAFIFLAIYFVIKSPKSFKIIIKPPLLLVGAAIALSLNYIGFMNGVATLGAATAQVVIQAGPLLLVLAGIFLFKEKVTRIQVIGFFVVVIGYTLFYSSKIESIENIVNFKKGVLWTLMGATTWATYSVFQKILVRKHNPQQINLFIYFFSALAFLPFVDFSIFSQFELWQWGLLLFLGLNTLVAYGALSVSFKYIEAYKVSSIVTLNPIITFVVIEILIAINVTWLDAKSLGFWCYLGAIIAICGVIMAATKRKK